jgi:hypothetical protein
MDARVMFRTGPRELSRSRDPPELRRDVANPPRLSQLIYNNMGNGMY